MKQSLILPIDFCKRFYRSEQAIQGDYSRVTGALKHAGRYFVGLGMENIWTEIGQTDSLPHTGAAQPHPPRHFIIAVAPRHATLMRHM